MVSIIIPVFNGQHVLQRCVDSVTKQSYRELEIILVDDGSTDPTLEICKKLALEDSRIKVFHQANKGVSAARNHGLANAAGELVMFVDADDSIDADMVEELVKAQAPHDADMAICGYKQISGADQKIVSGINFDAVPIKQLGDLFGTLYSKALINSPCAKIYKRRLIAQKFDESISLGEDLLFNLDFLKGAFLIAGIEAPLYNYFVSASGTLHTSYPAKADKLFLRIYSETNAYCHETLKTHKFDALVELRLITNMYGLLDSIYRNGQWKKAAVLSIIEANEVQRAARTTAQSMLRYRIFMTLVKKRLYRIMFLFFWLLNQYRRMRESKKCV